MYRMTLPAAAVAALLPISPAGAQTDAPATAADAQQTVNDTDATGGAAASADSMVAANASATGRDVAAAPPTPGNAQHAHTDQDQAIVITGIRRKAEDILGGVSVLDESALNQKVQSSIGETLANLPGVSATSFGPKASAPVLRGLSGERVRVLTDGIGTIDMSSLGPDHEVTINPITAQRIEVLRGPAALLFGSAAIGGVVNVIDNRIPRSVPKGPVGFDGFALYGTAANERAVNGSLNVPIGGHFILHADGNYDKTDNLHIGGHVLSQDLREEALASGDPDIEALADLKDTLPHSSSRTTEGAAGIAYVDGDLNIGFSVARHVSRYQVPIRYCFEPGCEFEQPTLTPHQTRFDGRAEIPLTGFLSMVKVRGGYSKYWHNELEADGSIGSHFASKGGEGRLELVQREQNGWGGTTGIQYLNRNESIVGEEVFLPASRQKQAGLFTLQTYVTGKWRFEGGARVESDHLTAKANAQTETPDESKKFTSISGSLGGQYEFSPGWRAGLSLSHTERAPFVNELFANGPHGGDETFEVGDPNLKKEKSDGIEFSLHETQGPVHLTGNLYYEHFSNFIFQNFTGEVRDDLPVFHFFNGEANFYGFELQGDAKLGHAFGIDWGGEFQGDYVHATVKSFGPAPRIPPLRILGALTGARGPIDGRIELERAFAHKRTAPEETDTPGYTLLNAAIDWHPFEANPELTLSLVGNNLLDATVRHSTSVLKDFAPSAGRDIRLSARVAF
jgi:iron complex outermembrane receptor protein